MNWLLKRLTLVAPLFCLAGPAFAAQWHHPLYLDGGGWWAARVRAVVHNEKDAALNGEPVTLSIGNDSGEAALVGQAAEAIRVCDANGLEMLFALHGPDGSQITSGPIPDGSTLLLPAECPPHATAFYYVYFDNPLAGELPDFLSVPTDLLKARRPDKVRLLAERPESMPLGEVGRDDPWFDDRPGDDIVWHHRAAVKVFNFSPQPVGRSLVSVDAGVFEARMCGRLNKDSMVVMHRGKRAPHFLYGNALLFEGSVPARTVNSYYVYFSDDPRIRAAADSDYSALLGGDRNLVKNPGFEQGDPMPDDWSASGPPQSPDGVSFTLDSPGRPNLGRKSAKMTVPHGTPSAWRGWQQSVPVQPGHTYLLAAWVKCEDVRGGEVRLHAHRHTADGSLSKHDPMVSCGPSISGRADWTLMSGQFTMPEDTVSFRIHLTMNTTGTVWHDGVLVSEIMAGSVVRLEGRPLGQTEPLKVWPVPAVVKVFQDDPVPREIPPARISAARNDNEPLQLAVRSGRAFQRVRVEVDPPVGPHGAKLGDLEVSVVGYVPVDHTTNYYRSDAPAWHRKIPSQPGRCDGWPGFWPDPLLPRDTFDLKPNTTQPVWTTVKVPKDAAPGDYTGTVRLACDGQCMAEVPFAVHLWDFTLPEESHVAAIYDVRLGRGNKLWGKSLDEIYPEIVRFMAQRRLCPDTVRPFPIIEVQNGQVVTDFTEFDKMAEVYFDQLKFPFAYTPWTFYLFGWGHPPKTMFGQRPYPGDPPFEDADRGQLRPEYKKTYQACLKAYWDHLKEKGWDKKVVLYISDEPFDRYPHIIQQMKTLCEMIHEVDPEIPIYCSTWKHVPEWDGYLDVWGIGHYGRVSTEKMAELRSGGDRLWFTTDGQMCTDTPYCAVERLLPHYCFKYDVEAYEFWGVAWLTYDPYRYGWHSYIRQTSEPGKSFWVRYPNGDGFLLYPGGPIGDAGLVSSIRLEQAREGVEDFEYLYLLRQLITQAKASGKDVTQAQAAMEQAARLVEIPNAGGRYSSQILPDPDALYQSREALAAAIEQLGR